MPHKEAQEDREIREGEKANPTLLRLTAKQDHYCRVRASGMNKSDAYRAAYDTSNMAAQTVYGCSAALERDQRIADRIEFYHQEILEVNKHDAAHLRAVALRTLLEVAENRNNPPSSRTRAAELLGKVDGVRLFEDTKQSESVEDAKNAIRTLQQKLKALVGNDKAVLIQPLTDLRPKAAEPDDTSDALLNITHGQPIPDSSQDDHAQPHPSGDPPCGD